MLLLLVFLLRQWWTFLFPVSFQVFCYTSCLLIVHFLFSFWDSCNLSYSTLQIATHSFHFLVNFSGSVYVSWVSLLAHPSNFLLHDSSITASNASINCFVAKFILCCLHALQLFSCLWSPYCCWNDPSKTMAVLFP